MNTVHVFVALLFVCTVIHARWITEKSDHHLVHRKESYWYIKVARPVNRPAFPAYIRFFNEYKAKPEYSVDVSTSALVLYYNSPPKAHIIFRTLDHEWQEDANYFITIDEGVLFSDKIENSTGYTNPKFWRFRCVRPAVPPNPTDF